MEESWLKIKNPCVEDNIISFDEARHKYSLIEGGKETHRFSISVTGLTSLVSTPFDEDEFIKMMSFKSGLKRETVIPGSSLKTTKYLKGHDISDHFQKQKENGTKWHAIVEKFYDSEDWINRTEDKSRELLRKLDTDGTMGCYIESLIDFDNTIRAKKERPFRVEFRVYSLPCDVCGTVDFITERTNDLGVNEHVIYEWKTAENLESLNKVYGKMLHPYHDLKNTKITKYNLQVLSYWYILDEYYGGFVNVKEANIVIFAPYKTENFIVRKDFCDITKLFMLHKSTMALSKKTFDLYEAGTCTDGVFPLYPLPKFNL